MIYSNAALKAGSKQELRQKVLALGYTPVLDIIQVGSDFASSKYVGIKQKVGSELGIKVGVYNFLETTSRLEIFKIIDKYKEARNGLIIQLPLPVEFESLIEAIPPQQDVDFLTASVANSWPKNSLPPTIGAIDLVLKDIFGREFASDSFKQKKVVIVGQGKLVGLPALKYFVGLRIQPEVVDIQTPNPQEICQGADILLSATGVAGLIKPDWIKNGAVVIDAGTSESKNKDGGGQLAGDVIIDGFPNEALLVPSPGGIGPITVLCLFNNLLTLIDLDSQN